MTIAGPLIGVALGWLLKLADDYLRDHRKAKADQIAARRRVRQAALALIAELRAAQSDAAASPPRLLPTDVGNNEGRVLADSPRDGKAWLVVAETYETINRSNKGDVTPAEAAKAAAKAETMLWDLATKIEASDPDGDPELRVPGEPLSRVRARLARRRSA